MALQNALSGWHDFYLTAGAAAATLAGLLFVGLSLHLRVVVSHPEVRGLARITLSDFFVVLVLALFLVGPSPGIRVTAPVLISVGLVGLALILRPFLHALRNRRVRTLTVRLLAARFLVSGLALLAISVLGVVLGTGDVTDALSGLQGVVVVLLVVAVRNTWDLLVTVAESSAK